MISDQVKLNKEQKQAVEHTDGPLLIVAGAGTGKTSVLIERLDFLINTKKIKIDDILLMTFTEKAAAEMEERADRVLPYGYVDLWINTFHSFCQRILRDHSLDIGLPGNFRLITQTEQWILLKKNLEKLELDYYKPLGNPTKFIHELIKHFSRLKDESISSKEYSDYIKKLKKGSDENDDEAQSELQRLDELARAYGIYNQILLDEGLLDFGDLIMYTIKLFKSRPNILKYYRTKFKYIMVDEFQDTNWAQYELIKLLSAPKNNLMVVGDDDQCLPGDSLVEMRDGKKRIDKIKKGEEVLTAVGKGHLGFSKVVQVSKNKKKTRLITLETKSGKKIATTDNHKLFCFTPRSNYFLNSEGAKLEKFYYVYLMHKQELGWRIGISKDLVVRLSLERSADKIVAILAYKTEEEARYNEVLLSLKYGIPTVVFQEREGMMTKRKWSEQLYKDLDVDSSVDNLARDLGIDLNAHQVSLEAVKRGGKTRIKINIEMCYRNYRSKKSNGKYLENPLISHLLSLETSDKNTIRVIKKMGFEMSKSKNGKRLRVSNIDIREIGRIAQKIKKETGAIIETKMNVGKTKIQHKKSLVIPASNVLPGMFLPVVKNKEVIYEQIIKRSEEEKNISVYDLEIDKTHNFVSNDIVVHNSVYKFRGASISNIMQFKDDYPDTKEVVLVENYRSGQDILDRSYDFIKHNNPNRLEVKLKIDKKLKSNSEGIGGVEHLHFPTDIDEVRGVANEIKNIFKNDKEARWSDFAILVRANDTALKFISELTREGVPNQFVSLRGLYFKPVILDVLAYFKLLDNYHESSALFRVLNMDLFKINYHDLVAINKFARRKVYSMYEALKNLDKIKEISPETVLTAKKLLGFIDKHSKDARFDKASKIFLDFARDSGLMTHYDFNRDQEIYDYLNQLYRKMKDYESADPDFKIKNFVEAVELEMEAGETGSLSQNFEDSEKVSVMTAHASKGLEFNYVFLVNLVDKKFPTIGKKEKIPVPDGLVKEKLPEGDVHIEEERRLFYVSLTRARKKLFLTSATDYGGAQNKKVSKFLEEMGFNIEFEKKDPSTSSGRGKVKRNDLVDDLFSKKISQEERDTKYELPKRFSFSQIAAYTNCPYQYRFNFILKIPIDDKQSFIFGRIMHDTLRDLFLPMTDPIVAQQELFETKKANKKKISRKDLLTLYENNWKNDGYRSKKDREKYYEKGGVILNTLYDDMERDGWPKPAFIEKPFNIKMGGYIVKGAIDRIDHLEDGTVEIIDYKTGAPKEKLDFSDKRQLLLYKIATEEALGLKVSKSSFYYLENNSKISFVAKEKELEKLENLILDTITEIKQSTFPPTPGFLCAWCDFNSICEFRKK
ncbi:MAG: UvrD-helicase domain-containing protein [Patescibacteria group bacterium]|jgi:DNA helicase-2/ATP-dependent DNA helicase PcrA|nr:UvrD-helicase domain-containing protein [Patescibacteria group bacterium]